MLFFLLAALALTAIVFSGSLPVRAVKALTLAGAAVPLKLWSFGWGGARDQETRDLKQKCLRLALENFRLKEMERENVRLRRLLAFKERSRYSYLPVEVIGRDPNIIINNTVIVKGGKDLGLKPDLPAVVADGLVGKVVEVSWNTAVVQLLLDQNARVSAVDQRSRELGIIEWYQGGLCHLKNIEKARDVAVGDTVVTSGMGGIYPKGVMIGTVVRTDNTQPDLFKKIVVSLNVDFSYLEEIFILRPD